MQKTKNSILIPNIQQKIKKKLNEFSLKADTSPKEFLEKHGVGRHRYVSRCQTKKGEWVAFYARLHNNEDSKNKFLQEIHFLETIKKSKLKIGNFIPPILNFGRENDFEWMIRRYLEGKALGFSRKVISPLPTKAVNKITDDVYEISLTSPKYFSGLKEFDYKNYLATGTYQDLAKKGVISKKFANQILRQIKITIPLLKKENHYLSHGDLNLGNIIEEKGKIWIIDWELISKNNFAYDIGYLWAHLWEAEKSFRQALISDYVKKLTPQKLEKFKKLLPVVATYLSLGGIEYKESKEKEAMLKRRRIFYLKLIENCLKPFSQLIKT